MIIAVNAKKTAYIATLGICLLGSIYTAYRIYLRSKKKQSTSASSSSSHHHNQHHHRTGGGGRGKGSSKSANGGVSGGRLERPSSLHAEQRAAAAAGGRKHVPRSISMRSSTSQTPAGSSDEPKVLPAEELLELGVNYLTQAIKSWETALDSIENAAYMQSNVLALPNDEHADLVFKLRNLVESANKIANNNEQKLVKSSQTLQIIQSRLAHKQQLYAEALIRNSSANYGSSTTSLATAATATAATSPGVDDDPNNNRDGEKGLVSPSGRVHSPSGSWTGRGDEFDDNESFVSADSDVDWLTEEMLQNIQNVDDKNVLYEMAVSNVNLGGVSYRVSRAELLNCASEKDFAAKLHVIRLGFDRLLQDVAKRQWFIDFGRNLLAKIMSKAEKDCTGLYKTYDEMIRYVSVESNWKQIRDELATRDVCSLNFYDVVLDFILLDAFDDLDNPPSAITAVIQNRWLSQSFKETALGTAVWSVLKAKRRLLKFPDGFITRFYAINEYLVPVLAWGFLGTDPELNKACHYLKSQVVDYLTCLFDMNRTRFTNLEELTNDIDMHSVRYLQMVLDNI